MNTLVTREVQENRIKFLKALRSTPSSRKVQGQMFRAPRIPGKKCGICAEGVAVEIFLGIDNLTDYFTYRDTIGNNAYKEIQKILALTGDDEILSLNDDPRNLSFPEIADELERSWGQSS